MLTLTACLAQSDSTAIYPVVRWKLERLLDVYFYDMPAMDSLQKATDAELVKANLMIAEMKDALTLMKEQRDVQGAKANEWERKFEEAVLAYQYALKKEKRKRKITIICGSAALLFSVLLL